MLSAPAQQPGTRAGCCTSAWPQNMPSPTMRACCCMCAQLHGTRACSADRPGTGWACRRGGGVGADARLPQGLAGQKPRRDRQGRVAQAEAHQAGACVTLETLRLGAAKKCRAEEWQGWLLRCAYQCGAGGSQEGLHCIGLLVWLHAGVCSAHRIAGPLSVTCLAWSSKESNRRPSPGSASACRHGGRSRLCGLPQSCACG